MQKFEAIRKFLPEDEHPIRPGEEGDYRTETFNQWVYDPVADVGFNIWFASGKDGGGEPFPNFMSTNIVFLGDETWISHQQGRGNHPNGIAAGNSFLTMVEPFKLWKIDFLGLLDRSSGSQQASESSLSKAPELSRMALTVNIMSPPIEQGTQGDRGEVAASGTAPRTAIRYEQLCRISGTITIGSRSLEVNAYGMRSHRRNSASIYDSGAVGHSWATALFPSGRGFHLLSYQVEPKGEVGFLYGHYFDGESYHEAEVLRFPYYSGAEGREQALLEMRVGDKTISVSLDTHPPLTSVFSSQKVRLTRSAARFTLDGETGGGVLERSLTSAYSAGGEFRAK